MGLETKVGRLIYDLQSLVGEAALTTLLEANTKGEIDLSTDEMQTIVRVLNTAYAPKFEGAVTQLQSILAKN